jgi:hypothetical protein
MERKLDLINVEMVAKEVKEVADGSHAVPIKVWLSSPRCFDDD